MKTTNAIAELYGADVEYIWSRHDTDSRIERGVLRQALAENFPMPPARVADIGGGNGRWAYELTEMGYRVALSDIAEPLIDDACRRAKENGSLVCLDVADARKLPYPSDYADAALMLGPMYGIEKHAGRVAALRELARVVRSGGVALIQYLTRAAGLRGLLSYAPGQAGCFDWQYFLENGEFREQHLPEFFLHQHWHTDSEARIELREAGLIVCEVRGMDGPAPGAGQGNLRDAPVSVVDQWASVAYAVGRDPAYEAACDHLLAVARVP